MDVNGISIRNRPHLGHAWQYTSQTRGGARRRQDQGPDLQRAMARVQLAPRGNDDEPRLALPFERMAQRPETVRGSREDEFGRPERPRTFGSDGTGADEHGIGKGAQQAHHESIRLIAAADDPAGGRGAGFEGHDAIDRADKVGVHAGIRDPEVAVIEFGQRRRQGTFLTVGYLEEPGERIQERCPLARARAMFRNSSRSSGFDS